MRPRNVFQLEIAGVFANARTTLMRLGYAYLLGLPFAVISLAPRVRVIGIAMLILFTSFFGSATTIVTRRTDGHMARLQLLPISRFGLLSDILLAASLVDVLQVGVVILVLLLVNATVVSAGLLLAIAGSFVLSVLVMNILGMLLGAVSRNSQEVHLIGAFGVAIIGFLTGLYPVPDRIHGIVDAVSRANPLRRLAESLELSMEGASAASPGWQGVLWAALLVAIIALFASRLTQRSSSRSR